MSFFVCVCVRDAFDGASVVFAVLAFRVLLSSVSGILARSSSDLQPIAFCPQSESQAKPEAHSDQSEGSQAEAPNHKPEASSPASKPDPEPKKRSRSRSRSASPSAKRKKEEKAAKSEKTDSEWWLLPLCCLCVVSMLSPCILRFLSSLSVFFCCCCFACFVRCLSPPLALVCYIHTHTVLKGMYVSVSVKASETLTLFSLASLSSACLSHASQEASL